MRRILIIASLIVGAISCTDNDDSITINQQEENFYALTVGNSWEYKYYLRNNSTNLFEPTTVIENVEITHTENINGNTFYNFKHVVGGNNGNYTLVLIPDDGENNYLLRDSLGYLINQYGNIKYVTSNNDDHNMEGSTDNSSSGFYIQLDNNQYNISTNAGNFNCLDNHIYFKDSNGNVSPNVSHNYRENGIGEILSTLTFAVSETYLGEKRLESYNIQ